MHHFLNKILGDSTKIDIIRLLLKQSDGLSGREMARMTGVSHFKTRIVAEELRRHGLFTLKRVGQANIYKLYESHFLFERLKSLFQMEEDTLDIIGEKLYKRLKAKPLSIILHGSMARKEERPDSDIDLLIVYDDSVFRDELTDEIIEKGIDLVSKFGNMLSPLAVSFTRFKEGVKEKGSLFREILKSGRVIAGLTMSEVLDYGRTKNSDNSSPEA